MIDGVDVDAVFEDKVSGKSMERPVLPRMIQHARQGYTVVVHSMDRMARNLKDLKTVVSVEWQRVPDQPLKENLAFSGKTDPYSE